MCNKTKNLSNNLLVFLDEKCCEKLNFFYKTLLLNGAKFKMLEKKLQHYCLQEK